jgi:putative endopeptidase
MKLSISLAIRLAAVASVALFAVHSGGLGAAAQQLSSGIDLTSLDRSCKPCDDFYQFANGGWIKSHPIPAAYPQFGTSNILVDKNRQVTHEILEAAAKSNAAAGTDEQKLGDYYASCMDTAAIAQAGTTPLDPLLTQIAGIVDTKSIAPVVAALQIDGVDAFFGFGSSADAKDSTTNIAEVDQGGLGLPNRDYYTNTDDKSVQLRAAYVAHVSKMLALIGETQAQADADAQTVLAIEIALAKNSLTDVQQRDPQATYHKMDAAALAKLSPNFDWNAFFTASGVSPTAINVSEPDFFSGFSTLLGQWTPAQIKTYLRWHTITTYAPMLPPAFADENFAFYSTTLNGTTAQLPLWRRCTRFADSALGYALGRDYVAKVFPPAAKARALELVKYVKETLRADIASLDWMTAQTKARAVEKLDAFSLKIGYPDTWRDYTNLTIVKGPFVVNQMASYAYETKRDYAKIGKPVDRSEWGMTPPTVNAYYNPSVNEIVFPAGILQPPFFNQDADMAVNFGAIGAVIGHESTHGFDDEGRQFDKNGNLSDWWTPQDAAAFNAKAKCIVTQFNALSPEPGVKENGELVQGEAIADLGGLTIAYKAFERWQAANPRRTIDGFTPEQRFFLGFAGVWGSSSRPEFIRLLANSDVHPYDKFRVNATLSNMPAFAAAWGCKTGTAMVRPASERCAIW